MQLSSSFAAPLHADDVLGLTGRAGIVSHAAPSLLSAFLAAAAGAALVATAMYHNRGSVRIALVKALIAGLHLQDRSRTRRLRSRCRYSSYSAEL